MLLMSNFLSLIFYSKLYVVRVGEGAFNLIADIPSLEYRAAPAQHSARRAKQFAKGIEILLPVFSPQHRGRRMILSECGNILDFLIIFIVIAIQHLST